MTLTLTQHVLFSEIFAPWNWNIRSARDDAATREAFAKVIKHDGLLSPLIVRPLEDMPEEYQPKEPGMFKWAVVSGFRRHDALTLVLTDGPSTVEAKVFIGEEVEALGINASENMARRDVTTYDLARQWVRMADMGASGATIAEVLKGKAATGMVDAASAGGRSYSKAYINALVRCFRVLPPAILTAWSEGHPCATPDNLRSVAKRADDGVPAMLAAWEAIVSPDENVDETAEGGSEDETAGDAGEVTPKAVRPRPAQLAEAYAAAKALVGNAKGAEATALHATVATLAWAMGKGNKGKVRALRVPAGDSKVTVWDAKGKAAAADASDDG